MSDSASATGQTSQTVLAFRLGETLHGFPIDSIEEVLPALPIESIAQCPPFVRGVVFVRGHLIAVLDAAERLGLTEHIRAPDPHIICLRWGGRLVGVEVDEALDLVELHPQAALPAEAVGSSAELLSAVVEHHGQIIRVLNPEYLISAAEAPRVSQLPRTEIRKRH